MDTVKSKAPTLGEMLEEVRWHTCQTEFLEPFSDPNTKQRGFRCTQCQHVFSVSTTAIRNSSSRFAPYFYSDALLRALLYQAIMLRGTHSPQSPEEHEIIRRLDSEEIIGFWACEPGLTMDS
jgi:hypothetical protein